MLSVLPIWCGPQAWPPSVLPLSGPLLVTQQLRKQGALGSTSGGSSLVANMSSKVCGGGRCYVMLFPPFF